MIVLLSSRVQLPMEKAYSSVYLQLHCDCSSEIVDRNLDHARMIPR